MCKMAHTGRAGTAGLVTIRSGACAVSSVPDFQILGEKTHEINMYL